MRNKAGIAWMVGSILVIVVLIVGCGGEGVQQPGPGPQPPAGTATLQGTVIAADNTCPRLAARSRLRPAASS